MPTFSFAEFIRVLVKNARTIIVVTLVVMIITAGVSFILPKKYKATTTLLISESKMGIDGVLSNYFNPRFYYTFEGLVKNKALALEAMDKFNLDEEPYDLQVESLLEQIQVGLVRNTRLIRLSVNFEDAELAANLANFIASQSVKLNEELKQEEANQARMFMIEQVQDVARDMKETRMTLQEYKNKAKIKELETDVETLLYTKADLRLRRMDAMVRKAEIKAGPVKKDENSSSVEEINALITSLDEMLKKVEDELEEKQKLLAERESTLENLMTLFDANQTSYRRINTRYGENATRVKEKFQHIRIIDPAVPPYYAEWPKKKLLTIIAGALAFIISCGYALLREQLRRTPELDEMDK